MMSISSKNLPRRDISWKTLVLSSISLGWKLNRWVLASSSLKTLIHPRLLHLTACIKLAQHPLLLFPASDCFQPLLKNIKRSSSLVLTTDGQLVYLTIWPCQPGPTSHMPCLSCCNSWRSLVLNTGMRVFIFFDISAGLSRRA